MLQNASEERVWDALLAQLGDGDLVVAGKRVTDHLKDHEVDFLVATERGIVCLEVKGGEIWHDGADWIQQRRRGPAVIEPVRQVRESCYALRSSSRVTRDGATAGCTGTTWWCSRTR